MPSAPHQLGCHRGEWGRPGRAPWADKMGENPDGPSQVPLLPACSREENLLASCHPCPARPTDPPQPYPCPGLPSLRRSATLEASFSLSDLDRVRLDVLCGPFQGDRPEWTEHADPDWGRKTLIREGVRGLCPCKASTGPRELLVGVVNVEAGRLQMGQGEVRPAGWPDHMASWCFASA